LGLHAYRRAIRERDGLGRRDIRSLNRWLASARPDAQTAALLCDSAYA
jgi:hypothetical protein